MSYHGGAANKHRRLHKHIHTLIKSLIIKKRLDFYYEL